MEEKYDLEIDPERIEFQKVIEASSTSTLDQYIPIGRRETYGEQEVDLVNVEEAKIQYEELRRELSALSQKTSPSKLELGQTDEFNLSEFLHGMSQELDANGKKRKHLGVLWENLHVEV
ncbi:hypothetical protein G6F38_013188 [Rhizopus arrhizus]|nr:hypothetical protein G6F38_013188 [Rhizopus arrhizus]